MTVIHRQQHPANTGADIDRLFRGVASKDGYDRCRMLLHVARGSPGFAHT